MTASLPPARGDKPPRRFPCPECPEWFWSRADLSRHRAANAHARPSSPPPADALREALVAAISVLENYGDHHEWCAIHEPGFDACTCGLDLELTRLRIARDGFEQVVINVDVGVAELLTEIAEIRQAAEEVVAAAIDRNEVLTRRLSDAIGALERALHNSEEPGLPTSTVLAPEGRPGDRHNSPDGTPSAAREDRAHEPLATARLLNEQAVEAADREAAGAPDQAEPVSSGEREGSHSIAAAPAPRLDVERLARAVEIAGYGEITGDLDQYQEWGGPPREVAQKIAAEYARLAGQEGGA